MSENSIELKTIKDLLGKKFFIPSYQRGYKWCKKDVEYLIDDIAEIKEDDFSDYCLQPIVVAPKSKPTICPTCGHQIHSEDEEYILVDGQQRLTTIWLIINWAMKNGCGDNNLVDGYVLHYETREDSNTYLQNLAKDGNAEDKGTCDTHYFSEAISAISSREDSLASFFKNLNKNVRIIWYVIDPHEGPAHFERLNSAKIGLTNAELVKAYILTNSTQDVRARMACEWDEVEYKLQNEEFFSFITTKYSIYSKEYNRIELLLDLYTGTTKIDKEKDEHATFNRIAYKVDKDHLTIREVWNGILQVFNRLLCWYEDNYLYNLIGFLVENKGDNELSSIWKDCIGKSTNEFKDCIRKKVLETMPSEKDVRNLVYKDPMTKNILLLFNILSMMSKLTSPQLNEYMFVFDDKFHFDLYKQENWDKEHIHATASQTLQSKVEWVNWLKGLDERQVKVKLQNHSSFSEYYDWILKAQKVSSEEYESIKEDKHPVFKQLTKEDFKIMYETIVKALEDETLDYDLKQNSIGNLVLLNANINRSGEYKVAPFSTKRRIIMERVRRGQFVPLGTQNVFMKVYTPNPGHFYKWEKDNPYDGNEKSDREYYIDAIVDVLNQLR